MRGHCLQDRQRDGVVTPKEERRDPVLKACANGGHDQAIIGFNILSQREIAAIVNLKIGSNFVAVFA
jgi:hypothetical protein